MKRSKIRKKTKLSENSKPEKEVEEKTELSNIFVILKPIGVAFIASLASIVTYVTTPLNEYVNSIFWKEKAQLILISQNNNIKQGDVVNVDIFINSLAPVPISEGILEINYTKANLRPGAESVNILVISTPKISGAKKLTNRSLEFIADLPGRAEVSATLMTKNKTILSKKLYFDILPATDQVYPTRRNFSGKWNIDLGGIHGHMDLKDVARTLSGEYKLSDGNYGQIEGARDGQSFRVTFYRGSAPSRFFIEAKFDPNPVQDLELKGNASLLIPSNNKNNIWDYDKKKLSFYGVGQSQ